MGVPMLDLTSIRVKSLKLEGPGFVAERYTANMKELTWLRLRQTGIGGYDFGLLAYPDDWGGPLSLYFDKLSPIAGVNEGNDYTDFGNDMQDVILRRTLPRKLMKLGLAPDQFRIYTSPWFYRSTVNPWHVMNLDGLVEFACEWDYTDEAGNHIEVPRGMVVAELKTADSNQREKWKDGATPDRYFGQGMHYPIGLGLPGTLMFCLLNRTPLLRYLPRTPEFDAYHHEVCSEFWGRVERRDPPMAFGGDADLQAVRKLYPVGGETAKVLEGLEPHVEALVEARKRMKEAKADTKRTEAFLKSETGDASGLVSTDGNTGVKWTRGLNKAGRPINRLTPRVNGKEEEEEEE